MAVTASDSNSDVDAPLRVEICIPDSTVESCTSATTTTSKTTVGRATRVGSAADA